MTVVEAVIAIAVFSLVAGAAMQVFATSNRLATRGLDKDKALWLAEEGIEAVRSLRDASFGNLSPGTRGLALAGGRWQYAGTSDVTDGFVRSVTITPVDADAVYASSSVSWSDRGATSTVSVGSRFTNWRKSLSQADGMTASTTSGYLTSGNTALLTNILLTTSGSVPTTTVQLMQISWNQDTPETRFTYVYSPNGTVVYGPATASTDTTITVTNPIVMTGATTRSLGIRWNMAMAGGKTFTIKLIFSDASTYTFNVVNPPTK